MESLSLPYRMELMENRPGAVELSPTMPLTEKPYEKEMMILHILK